MNNPVKCSKLICLASTPHVLGDFVCTYLSATTRCFHAVFVFLPLTVIAKSPTQYYALSSRSLQPLPGDHPLSQRLSPLACTCLIKFWWYLDNWFFHPKMSTPCCPQELMTHKSLANMPIVNVTVRIKGNFLQLLPTQAHSPRRCLHLAPHLTSPKASFLWQSSITTIEVEEVAPTIVAKCSYMIVDIPKSFWVSFALLGLPWDSICHAVFIPIIINGSSLTRNM